jgi:hypothetical protein
MSGTVSELTNKAYQLTVAVVERQVNFRLKDLAMDFDLLMDPTFIVHIARVTKASLSPNGSMTQLLK